MNSVKPYYSIQISRISESNHSNFNQPNSTNDDMAIERRKQGKWKFVAVFILAGLVPVFLMVVHMTVFATLWRKDPIDKANCGCPCWDTIFKGPYEYGGVTRYKHVYFNSNSSTFKIWICTVFWIIFMYEAFKRFFSLLFLNQIRWSMGILVLGSLHCQYYAWWAHVNFWNDDFYPIWSHQFFFTVTDGASFVLILLSLDRAKEIKPSYVLTVFSIAVFHVLSGGTDQFINNVLDGQGDVSQVLRDILLMSNDILAVIMSIIELRQYAAAKNGTGLWQFLRLRPNLILMSRLFIIMTMYIIVFPQY